MQHTIIHLISDYYDCSLRSRIDKKTLINLLRTDQDFQDIVKGVLISSFTTREETKAILEEIKELRSDFNSRMDELRTDFNNQMKEMRLQFDQRFNQFDIKLNSL